MKLAIDAVGQIDRAHAAASEEANGLIGAELRHRRTKGEFNGIIMAEKTADFPCGIGILGAKTLQKEIPPLTREIGKRLLKELLNVVQMLQGSVRQAASVGRASRPVLC
jgi:hypothetical protein